jgi:1H-pyrrole-2-carbonyl-[peptidyl-carrier protein] chlorinase
MGDPSMQDVVIMGGGPAGLTLGCYLVKAGVPCLIIERGHHPRPHVGESLMPATIRVLREIGFQEAVETAGFPRSGGVVYHPQMGSDVSLAYGDFPQDEIEQDYTYHVDRARFDMLLMKHAESLGCRIIEGVTVDQVTFDEEGTATGVVASLGGQKVEIPARIVVDAAGRSTRLGRQLGLRRDHPVLDQFALHTWCVDVDRGPVPTESYTHVYFLPEVRGWAWMTPVDEDITSVGLVASRDAYTRSGLDIEEFFVTSMLGSRKLARAMIRAERINDLKGEANYSYGLDQVCGDGWLAIGDAARFIDPIFSSGVSVAMHSARLAARTIEAALKTEDTRRSAFQPYEDHVLASSAIWDDFIRLFYRLLPAFTQLLESDEHRKALVRMIQGDVHGGSDADILDELRALVRAVEDADTHPRQDDLAQLPL